MLAIHKLYPQYNIVNDRRKQSLPVENDRRTGFDRRSSTRVHLDTGLTRDLFEVKAKVSQLQNNAQKKIDHVTFTQNVPRAAQNSLKTDVFVRTTKPESQKNDIKQEKSDNVASVASAMGALSCILGGLAITSCFGSIGVGMAAGLSAYFGGKVFKEIIVSHLRK